MKWGQLLHEAAMPLAHTANVMKAWAKIDDHAGRRFSSPRGRSARSGRTRGRSQGCPGSRHAAARLAVGTASRWRRLPVPGREAHARPPAPAEYQSARRARRRHAHPHSARHRAAGRRLHAATLTIAQVRCRWSRRWNRCLAWSRSMSSARPRCRPCATNSTAPASEKKPYHVVHFDGHGVYDRPVGLGGLCFEHPEDIGKLEKRRHVTVFTRLTTRPAAARSPHPARLPRSLPDRAGREGVRVRRLRVAEGRRGLGRRHEPQRLVETARRFVEAFYDALADGKRVGDAMLAGQRQLKDDTFRGRIFGAGELRLEDWFVPVLFQEKDDPQLFKTTPAKQTQEDFQTGSRPASANCRRRPRPASSAAAANCSRSSGCCETNATPWCAARAAKARRRSPPSLPAGWSARSRFAAPRSSPWRRMAISARCVDALGRQLVSDRFLRCTAISKKRSWKSNARYASSRPCW